MVLVRFRDDWIISSQTLLGMLLLIHAGIKVNQEVGAPAGRFCISFLRNIPGRARKGLVYSGNTWLCVHWQWNTLEWCQLNALQAMKHTRVVSLNAREAKPGVHLVDTTRVYFIVHFETAQSKPFIVFRKWQIRPRPLRVCVNIPEVAERECQNPPASAPQPLHACVNVA